MHTVGNHEGTMLRGGYSYNKSQRDALFLKFILVKGLYVIQTVLLPIIRSLNTVYAE
jgi:hypothetical protein